MKSLDGFGKTFIRFNVKSFVDKLLSFIIKSSNAKPAPVEVTVKDVTSVQLSVTEAVPSVKDSVIDEFVPPVGVKV